MKSKVLLLSACAGILVVSSIAFSAQPNDSAMEKHHQKMMADLKLTADQQSKIQALHKGFETAGKTLVEQMKGINEKVKTELLKDQPSKQVLDGYAVQLADIQKQLIQKRFDHVLQVKTILTKEQFSKHISHEWMGCAGMCEVIGEGGHGHEKGESMDKGGHHMGHAEGEEGEEHEGKK
jgi:Spy/CpxP family protein refolding chaperone